MQKSNLIIAGYSNWNSTGPPLLNKIRVGNFLPTIQGGMGPIG